jgi:Flp pilus assembly protein protease CpaA
MFEIIFLIVLAGIWVTAAVINDVKKTEVPDWLNFSLIIFALGFRFFYCFFEANSFGFFYQGLIGLGVFIILGNLLYYSRFFAGGDAKLMIALGAILPLSTSLYENINFFIMFLFVFLFVGLFYSLILSFGIAVKNFKNFRKEFVGKIKLERVKIYLLMLFGLALMGIGFYYNLVFYLGIVVFILPLLYIFAYSVEESSMIKKVNYNNLTEGDWLYGNVKVGKKTIVSTWEGLSKEDIKLLKKYKKNVMIKKGIPFTPVFLISFIIFVFNLWYPFWDFNIF